MTRIRSTSQRSSHRQRGGVGVALLLLLTVIALGGFLMPRPGKQEQKPPQAPVLDARVTSTPLGVEYNQRAELLKRGQVVYHQYCAGCHGVNGDGNGPAATRLLVQPRDFTHGVYKFRSTKQLQLPLESDLHRTITRGLPGVSMPAFPLLAEQDKVAVTQYVKTFFEKWEEKAADREVVYVPRAPEDMDSPERILRGRVVYLTMGCGRCHGSDGAGTGASIGYVDDRTLGKIRPRNFTRGSYRGGDSPEDVYRTFHSGLAGAMPAFGGNVNPDNNQILYANRQTAEGQTDLMEEGELERLEPALKQFPDDPSAIAEWDYPTKQQRVERNSWDLVAYVLSLRKGGGKPTAPPPAPPPAPTQPTGNGDDYGDDYGDSDDYGDDDY